MIRPRVRPSQTYSVTLLESWKDPRDNGVLATAGITPVVTDLRLSKLAAEQALDRLNAGQVATAVGVLTLKYSQAPEHVRKPRLVVPLAGRAVLLPNDMIASVAVFSANAMGAMGYFEEENQAILDAIHETLATYQDNLNLFSRHLYLPSILNALNEQGGSTARDLSLAKYSGLMHWLGDHHDMAMYQLREGFNQIYASEAVRAPNPMD